MSKLYLICDESEAKGFADNQEKFEGEFGVFAGYLLTDENYMRIESEIEHIVSFFTPKTGEKLHAAALSKDDRVLLEDKVFECFNRNKVSCVYVAVSVKGYHDVNKEIYDLGRKCVEYSASERYSFSKNAVKDRLHSDLFQSLFAKTVEYHLHYLDGEIEIDVTIDRIDKRLKKEFCLKIREFINILNPITHHAFDKLKQFPVRGSIEFSNVSLSNDKVSKTKFTIDDDVNAMTIVADVIAHSVSRELKKSVQHNPDVLLNSVVALNNHPLLSLFYDLSSGDNFNDTDLIYRRMK